MAHFTVVLAAIASISYVVFRILDHYITAGRIAVKARELGCQEPPQEHFRLPFGIDNVRAAMAADKEKLFPDWIVSRANKMGVHTWRFDLFGTRVITTREPQNIQALLATQFGAFDLGPHRRGLVGHG